MPKESPIQPNRILSHHKSTIALYLILSAAGCCEACKESRVSVSGRALLLNPKPDRLTVGRRAPVDVSILMAQEATRIDHSMSKILRGRSLWLCSSNKPLLHRSQSPLPFRLNLFVHPAALTRCHLRLQKPVHAAIFTKAAESHPHEIMRVKKGGKGKAVAKGDLPTKTCVVCNRPFTW